ncbi:sensor histidine kinase [Rubinisphaera margarita]|uniref:sensor histidine kinase n=1 Tax=Rubinisphaera margarita TaxID=2909586 RepID=UPI001EE81163|nr:HAMP domain-containing sensor histidine kinase [Rubinisphaera margarita]MCG6154280.1 HAMP domain-containing histidine kinase [Rubinisphaera margarita]
MESGGDNRTSETLTPDARHLAALMQFSAAAGHEINNPLAVILGRVYLLLKDEADPVRRQSLETIAGQAGRIRDMIGDVMLFADPPPPDPVELDATQIVREVMDRQQKIARQQYGRTPEIELKADKSISVHADRDQFATVVGELLRNALHPTVEADHITVHLTADEESLHLQISDNGRGMSEEERQHLFDPFYSGRQAGRGLGFGLSKAWQFARMHGANIEARSANREAETETEFRVLWPRVFPQ